MWEKLIVDRDDDPWGKLSKIVSGKLKKKPLLVSLERQVGTLTELRP